MLTLHILAGIIVLLCALVAFTTKKGASLHRLGGNAFFISMLIVSASAIYLDMVGNEIPVIGILVLYLVSTSWVTIKRKEGTVGLFEKIAFFAIVFVAIGFYLMGWQSMGSDVGTKNEVPAAMFFVFGSIALFAAVLDLVMLIRGGVSGKHRVARHLWRMCIPTIFAIMSVLSQKAVIPDALKGSPLLWVPILLVFLLMIYWLIRVLFTHWLKNHDITISSIQRLREE
jgi:uncharacterized membrane protein